MKSVYAEHHDNTLVDFMAGGDEQAFAELHRRYKGVLFLHAFRMLDSEEEAKDIVQELFVTLWVRREGMIVTSSFSSYLYSAVRNRVLDLLAKKKNEEKYIRSLGLFLEQGENLTDSELREKELARILEREVELLPTRMKEVFQLSRVKNLSYREIAEELNISDKTVKKQVSNALIILRKKLEAALTLCFSL